MAIESFNWSPRLNASADTKLRNRKAQFGDGYSQVSGDGLNNKSQEWSLEFVGTATYIKAIKDFLDRHAGTKSFIWIPPLEPKGLFRCDTYKPVALGGESYSLSATFQQAPAP